MSRSIFIADEASGSSGDDSHGGEGSDGDGGSIGEFVADEEEEEDNDEFNHRWLDNKLEEEDDKLLAEEGRDWELVR